MALCRGGQDARERPAGLLNRNTPRPFRYAILLREMAHGELPCPPARRMRRALALPSLATLLMRTPKYPASSAHLALAFLQHDARVAGADLPHLRLDPVLHFLVHLLGTA